jgi:hypothetical protein
VSRRVFLNHGEEGSIGSRGRAFEVQIDFLVHEALMDQKSFKLLFDGQRNHVLAVFMLSKVREGLYTSFEDMPI